MAEDLHVIEGTKEEQYKSLLPQIKGLLEGETDLIANLANVCAALKEQFKWLWIGFYIVKNNELVVGPFQGPVACTRIKKGRGVCGTSWAEARTIIVNNVEKFPGHIACSSLSKSEIVVPIIKDNEVIGVLDVDSEYLNYFDAIDQKYLELIIAEMQFCLNEAITVTPLLTVWPNCTSIFASKGSRTSTRLPNFIKPNSSPCVKIFPGCA